MGHAARNIANGKRREDAVDLSKARLVRRGPGGHVPMMTLRALREASGKTQAQITKVTGIAQPEISKLETADSLDDRMLATLRRYVGALGDDLELVAVSKNGHRIGVVSATPLTRAQENETTLLLSLVELQASVEMFSTKMGARWHEAARLLDALKNALETTSPVVEDRVTLPIKNAKTPQELERAAATARASKWWGRDGIAVVLREATESLNAKVSGKPRGNVPRLGEIGPVEIKLRDAITPIMKRGWHVGDDGTQRKPGAARVRDLNAAELAAFVDILAVGIDLDARVLPRAEDRVQRFTDAIGKLLRNGIGVDAEQVITACARALGVKRPMFEAARKRFEAARRREERTSPGG